MLGAVWSKSSNIVARLRLVFAAISIVVISSIVVGFIQLVTFDRASLRLTDSSIPVLENAQSLERNLQNLLSSLQKISTAETQEVLTPLRQMLDDQLLDLRTDIEVMSLSGLSEIDAMDMAVDLLKVESNAKEVVATKTALIAQTELLKDQIRHVAELRASSREVLEELSYDSPLSIAPDLAVDGPIDQNTLTRLEQRYYLNLLQANNLTELNLQLDSIAEFSARLGDDLSAGNLRAIERSIRLKFQTVTVLISQMPDTERRLQLARDVSAMRETLLGDDPTIGRAVQISELRASVQQSLVSQLQLTKDISDISDTLTLAAKNQVDLATRLLADASRKLEFTLGFGSLATLCFLLAASILVVERQINRRMSRLTHSVLTIADGQTDFPVNVEGSDELGDIATALETFKFNAEELRRSNVELQQFAYVAAHDLRSPLRAIQDLAEWTLEDPDNNLSDDSRQNLDLLLKRTRRLSLLLNDLLEYARVGHEEEQLSEVSMKAQVNEISTILDSEGAYNIHYTGPDLVISTFVTPMQQILLNLISNSMKHHDRDSGQIAVSAHVQGDRIRISVKDDGAGIHPQYHDRIFGLFQTLRPRDEVEGSGLGLAIIRKLIERYDGKISIISDPQVVRGTEFVFDLPQGLYFAHSNKRAA